MIFSGSFECIGSEVPPKLSKFELHMLFPDPVKGHSLAAAGSQFLLRADQSFSKKGSEMEMQAFSMQILVMELKELRSL